MARRAVEGAAARGHRQGRHRQDHGRRRAGAGAGRGGPTHAADRGRGPPGHRPAVRHAAAAVRGAPASPWRRAAARCCALAVDAEAALLEYFEMFYRLGRAGPRAAQDGRHRLRHHARPRPARRAAHRQGQGGRHPHRQHGAPRLRRGRPRRAADRPDRHVPRRHAASGRARASRPDPRASRRRDARCCTRHRRPCTSSRCWRRCRSGDAGRLAELRAARPAPRRGVRQQGAAAAGCPTGRLVAAAERAASTPSASAPGSRRPGSTADAT